ncbi:Sec-independent protein translocase protein TatB [Acinetobacter towneri]|uniref:Sec-independent protein translocase protein TatB n=1 Tax=Acinetobacter towneri TaxID=202956 RepID=UPI00336BFC6A
MLNIGMTELLIFGIIALLVLGPEKLPEATRFVGKWYSKIKRMVSNVQNDIDRELRLSELREQMQQEMARIQELEAKMQAQMHEIQQEKIFEDTTAKNTHSPHAVSKNTLQQHHYTLVLNTEKTSAVLLPKTKMTSHSNLSALQHTTAPYTEMKVAV